MPVSEKTFEQLALEDDETTWELVCGHLREKPPMTQEHNTTASRMIAALVRQLDEDQFEVRSNAGHVSRPETTYLIPDVAVLPVELVAEQHGTHQLERYSAPLPFVVEIWSRSTGTYDVDTKFPEYMARGDREIWRIHPYEKTLIAWRRQPDGSYSESHYAGGIVAVESLPGVVIRLDDLFR
jgi:Uma2 family endonuclease